MSRGPRVDKILKEQDELLTKLQADGLAPNALKKKLRMGKNYRNKAHTCNNGGGKGRAGRRLTGWSKHGKGPQNVPR